jgi:hypothetical protein
MPPVGKSRATQSRHGYWMSRSFLTALLNQERWNILKWFANAALQDLIDVLSQYGEQRDWKRQAKKILKRSSVKPLEKINLWQMSAPKRNQTLKLLSSLKFKTQYDLAIRLDSSDLPSIASTIPDNVVVLRLYGKEEVNPNIIVRILKRLRNLKKLKIIWDVPILHCGRFASGHWFTFAAISGLYAFKETEENDPTRDSLDVGSYLIIITQEGKFELRRCAGYNCPHVLDEGDVSEFKEEVLKWFGLCKSLIIVKIDISGECGESLCVDA